MATIKTAEEIKKIKKACEITDKIFKRIISNFKFKTEIELANFINLQIKKEKVKPSFPCIVAAAENAAEPHHIPKNRRLEGFIVIDFGVIYKRYMSDMTRTVYLGKPSKKEIETYNLLLKSQTAPIEKIKNGMKCRDAHLIASNVLGKMDKYFIHSLGHGVGTKIHEKPRIRKKSKRYLRNKMVITVEPGLYVKGKFGMRIEDTCVIENNKCIPLTLSEKKLIIITR